MFAVGFSDEKRGLPGEMGPKGFIRRRGSRCAGPQEPMGSQGSGVPRGAQDRPAQTVSGGKSKGRGMLTSGQRGLVRRVLSGVFC